MMKKNLFFFLALLPLCAWSGVEPVASSGVGVGVGIKKAEPTTNDPNPPKKPLPDYFDPKVKHPLGVRPDCSEKKVGPKELENLAKDGKVKNTVDFLNSLPKDSFQTFTLITNSKSAQRCDGPGMVSDEWPRVLRTSADGKTTFSYTCNPASCAYNKIEVIYYDDNGKEMKTMSVDLAQKPDHRVEHNDKKCLTCHATTMPDGSKSVKPIWPEYFQWGGCDGKNSINMYGSNDDNMRPEDFRRGSSNSKEYAGCSDEDLMKQQVKEIAGFQKFKAKNLGTGVNNNPCYSSLPWAKPQGEKDGQYDAAKYPNYPYSTDKLDVGASKNSDKMENYYLRPNLKFTEMYARLNAKRIAALVEKSPNFERMKYFLAMETSGCLRPEDEKTINEVLPGLNYKYAERNLRGQGYSDPRQGSPLLYAYGNTIGLTDSDWTLEFLGKDPKYNAAIPRKAQDARGSLSYDTGMPEVAGGQIVELLAKENPKLAATTKDGFTEGTAEGFGPQWSCIDDLGGAVREGYQGQKRPLCVSLRAALNDYLPTINVACTPVEIAKAPNELAKNVGLVTGKLDEQTIKKGLEIVNNRCNSCHQVDSKDPGALEDMAFFEDPKNPSSPEAKKNMLERLKKRVFPNITSLLKDGSMPASGEKLGDEDQKAVLQYLESIQRTP